MDFFNNERKCRCGYCPLKTEPEFNQEKCSSSLALQNHIVYPSFKLLNKTSSLYYNSKTNLQNKHWAFIIEIEVFIQNKTKNDFSLKCKTLFEEKVDVFFSLPKNSQIADSTRLTEIATL